MTKRGYKQTAEHIAKRKRYGAAHAGWLGDEVSVRGGRSRAIRRYEAHECTSCGNPRAERHHVNGNTANNESDNIAILCRRCHMLHDGRLAAFAQTGIANIKRAVRWQGRTDTTARSGDICPDCGHTLGIIATRRSGLVYIGCRRERGGCGHNAGSYRRV